MVREALGEEAIIVATREDKNAVGGTMMHITAAIDRDFTDHSPQDDLTPTDANAPNKNWLYADDDDEAMVIEEITDTMLRHAVPDEILDQVVSCAAVLGIDEPRLALLSAIESLFKFNPLPLEPAPTPYMMIGAAGAGKTLAAAKMAARSAMSGLQVAVITTDTERAGGVEQLSAFTKLMDIDLKVAKSPAALKEILLSLGDMDQVIIDSAGVNPYDADAIKSLARMIGAAEVIPLLVMPANTNAEEAAEMAEIFATIGAQGLLPTRVDAARRLGSILSAAYQGGLALADVSSTAKVANGLSPLTSKRLTQLLMPLPISAKIQKPQKAG